MKKLILLSGLVLLASNLFGQNRLNYSQYMHNHQAFNPAYVEESSEVGGSILFRNQWMGIEGAPTNFVANLYGTVGRSNIGLQFLYDDVTIYRHLEIGASYSYSLRLGVQTLMSFGIKASYNQQTADYTQLEFIESNDPYLSGVVKKNGLNMGTGIFVRNPEWHAGLGAPYLFSNGIVDDNTNLYNDVSYQHFFLTGGYRALKLRRMSFYPTTLIKWTAGAPLNMSLDMNFLFEDQFWFSTGYRTDNTVILSAGIIFWKNLKLVYSYDLGLGKVNRFGGMTHEFTLGYGMDFYRNSFVNRKYVKKNRTPKGGRTPRKWRR